MNIAQMKVSIDIEATKRSTVNHQVMIILGTIEIQVGQGLVDGRIPKFKEVVARRRDIQEVREGNGTVD